MAGLRPEEVSLLVDELRPVAQGARVEKVFDRGRSDMVFPIIRV